MEFLWEKDNHGYTPFQLACINGFPDKITEYVNPYSPTMFYAVENSKNLLIPKIKHGRISIPGSLIKLVDSYEFYSYTPVSYRYIVIQIIIDCAKHSKKEFLSTLF